jgi:DNA replication and repair protein RecF
VHLVELKLRGFRNLRDQELELPCEGVTLIGDNAQGKTNFLEAIHYLELLRSFRGARDRELVRFGEDHFRIQGRARVDPGDRSFDDGRGERTVAAAWQRAGSRKKVTLDGVEPERLGDAVGQVGVVVFSPDDLSLVSDGPQVRRRFLDIVLSLSDPSYLSSLQRYRQVLAQRNAALREGSAVNGAAAWEGLLVREGARIIRARVRWVLEAAEGMDRIHRRISGGQGAAFQPRPGVPGLQVSEAAPGGMEETAGGGGAASWGLWSQGEVEEAFREALVQARDRERRTGTTVVGPHRDELQILIGSGEGAGRDVRRYGSGGQRRSVALALRLLEAETIRRTRGREPILLLDDVFAELDPARSSRLLELLESTAVGQVVLTAPGDEGVRFRRDRLAIWRIREGEIST